MIPTDLVFESGEFEAVLNLANRAANSRATILLTGESGTGKERLAQFIHATSPRADMEFVAVNCSALPESLIESELFGYERGSFTGAARDHMGLFEQADGGTLFIDEIGDLPSSIQVKLLRFLQDHRIMRVGGRTEIQLDVRIITATHRNLVELVRAGSFREDLYYRLNVVTIHIPPLRHRRRDIHPLVDYFSTKFSKTNRKTIRGLSPAAWQRLLRYDWPGNVRELENAIEHAVVMTNSDTIDETDLPKSISGGLVPFDPVPNHLDDSDETNGAMRGGHGALNGMSVEQKLGNFFELVEQFEQELVFKALSKTNGNRSEAARLLGISEKNVRDRLAKWKRTTSSQSMLQSA